MLVAGLGVSSGYWVPLGRRLASQFHVIAPDLPGFGRTARDRSVTWPGGPNAREQADQLLAWMDAYGIERATLCGHSNGCQTIVDLAVRFPGRVERVILASPTYELLHRSFASQLSRLALAAFFEKPSLHPVLIGEYALAGLHRVLQQALRTIPHELENQLPHVRSPALVIRGEFDPMVSRRWAEFVTVRLPDAVLVEIELVGHAVQYSSAAITAKLISQFLDGAIDLRHTGRASEIIPMDDPRHDPLGPPQPISPGMKRALDWCAAAAMLTAPFSITAGPRTKKLLNAFAGITMLSALANDPEARLPVISTAVADIFGGIAMLIGAVSWLRREPRAGRITVAAFGLIRIVVAALTAKPTGPARVWQRVRPSLAPAAEAARPCGVSCGSG